MTSIANLVLVSLTRPRTLLEYKPQKSLAGGAVKKLFVLSLCSLIGFIYGLLYSFLPTFLYVYLALPILGLALVVIWALPQYEPGPVRLLRRLIYVFLIVSFIWPTYLALELPGLPWISFRRLIGFPMSLILLITLSVSVAFRAQVAACFKAAPATCWLVVAFTLLQLLTIPFSPTPARSINILVSSLFTVNVMFVLGCWLCAKPGEFKAITNLLLAVTFFLCVIGILELLNKGVLWANHIPSFLQVDDPSVQRTLTANIRDGAYRVTTVFSVSLSFAEFLAICSPFALHRAFTSKSIWHAVAWAIFDVVILAVAITTRARLGLIGWTAAHAFYVMFWAVRRWRSSPSDLIGPAVSLAYPAAMFVFIISMFTVDGVRNRTIGGGSSGLSDDARRQQFELFWPKLLQHPFGAGAGSSGDVLGYRNMGGMVSVDSFIITIGLDFGILGLLVFFGMLIVPIVKMAQISLSGRLEHVGPALQIGSALAAILVIRTVLSQQDSVSLFFLLIGAAAALQLREFNSNRTLQTG